MASGINLLPREFEPKGSILRISKGLKTYVIVSGIVFFVASILAVGTLFMLGRKVNTDKKSNDQLKNQISALKETEAALVLVQDRIQKINSVDKESQAKEEINILTEIRTILTEGVVISDSHLKEDIAEITLQSEKLTDMTDFLNIATNLSQFKSITLVSFEFKPGSGYKTTLGFIK